MQLTEATTQTPRNGAPPLNGMHEPWDRISRQLRTGMGIGRDKFARLLNVSPRTVMRWENGGDGGRVLPQGVQRMKLLALSLDANADDHQQEIIENLLEEAAQIRSQYEQRATSFKRYRIDLDPPPPAWFDDLLRLKREANWSALLLMAPHFLPREQDRNAVLHPAVESMVYLWVGIAAFMEGYPQKADYYYGRGLEIEHIPTIVHCVLLSNKGYALIRLRKFDEALEAFEACLRIDSSHRGALRNRLALFSQTGDEAAARRAAAQLLERYPEAGDPESELGQLILADPDLVQFRETKSFGLAFPDLIPSHIGDRT